jgi:hypothetical protein
MNLKALLLLTIVALTLVSSLFAIGTAQGVNQYGRTELEAIDSIGLIKLNGTSIKNQLQLVGSLIAQDAKIGSLNITGEANLTGCTVENEGKIVGAFQATKSNFKKNLTISSQKILLTACKAESLTIHRNEGFKGKQTLELTQNTVINGTVVFESGKGEVVLHSPGSQVLGGVVGGKIIKRY